MKQASKAMNRKLSQSRGLKIKDRGKLATSQKHTTKKQRRQGQRQQQEHHKTQTKSEYDRAAEMPNASIGRVITQKQSHHNKRTTRQSRQQSTRKHTSKQTNQAAAHHHAHAICN